MAAALDIVRATAEFAVALLAEDTAARDATRDHIVKAFETHAAELAALRAENAELMALNQRLVREVELYRDRDFDEVGDDLK